MRNKIIQFLIIFNFSILSAIPSQNSISGGFEYNQWFPLKLKGLNMETYGYNVAFLEISLSSPIEGLDFLPKIPKFRFETNFNSKYQKEIVELKNAEADPDKYLKILGFISSKKDDPLNVSVNGKDHTFEGNLTFKYENEAFITEIKNDNKLYYIDSNDNEFCIEPDSPLLYSTLFNSYSIGFLKEESNTKKKSSILFFKGAFFSQYKKPYYITLNTTQNASVLYYADFQALGFEYYGDFKSKYLDLESNFKLGYAKINLCDDFSMEDVSVDAKNMGYFDALLSPIFKINLKNFNLIFGCQYNFKLFATRYDSHTENQDVIVFKTPVFNYEQLLKYQLLLNLYF